MSPQFLYIDLFIIIPIAVTSKNTSTAHSTCVDCTSSGTHPPLSSYIPQRPNCKPCIQKGAIEHNRTSHYHWWRAILGVLLGPITGLVSSTVHFQVIGLSQHLGTRHRKGTPLVTTTVNLLPETMKTLPFSWCPAFSTSSLRRFSVLGRHTGNPSGLTVRDSSFHREQRLM